MDEHLQAYRQRDTDVTVKTGAALPAGATYEAEIRATRSPTSARLAEWTITLDGPGGNLYLHLPAGALPAGVSGGYTDVVQVLGAARTTVVPPLYVQVLDAPTVVGAG